MKQGLGSRGMEKEEKAEMVILSRISTVDRCVIRASRVQTPQCQELIECGVNSETGV